MDAVVERPSKNARMDLRMNETQKRLYEMAARYRNKTLTDWSLDALDEAAEREIENHGRMILSAEDFERFCELLEQPMPERTVKLLEREPRWTD